MTADEIAAELLFMQILDVVVKRGGFETLTATDVYVLVDVREPDQISRMVADLAKFGGREDTMCARVLNEGDTRKITAVIEFSNVSVHLRGQSLRARTEVA